MAVGPILISSFQSCAGEPPLRVVVVRVEAIVYLRYTPPERVLNVKGGGVPWREFSLFLSLNK